MKIFISWSGTSSHSVALALKEWLPSVIQAVEPFVSSEDIQKGVRSFPEISQELEAAHFGIVCLTPENLSAPWLLFEAGALSKSLGQGRVSPLLVGVKESDVKGPLAQFQMTKVESGDVRKLVKTMNAQLPESQRLDDSILVKAFDKWWPDLEPKLTVGAAGATVAPRSERDILEEVLSISRRMSQEISEQRKDHHRREAIRNLMSLDGGFSRDSKLVETFREAARQFDDIKVEVGTAASKEVAQPLRVKKDDG